MTEITTAEELDALPVGSVVRDRDRDEWTKRATPAVWVTPETRPFGSEYVARKWAPLTLVSRPDAPAPPAEGRERCGVCDRDGGQHWYDHFPAARQPAPVVSAEQVERAASRAAEHLEEEDAEGPIDCRCGGHCGPESIETHRLHVALAALGIEVHRG